MMWGGCNPADLGRAHRQWLARSALHHDPLTKVIAARQGPPRPYRAEPTPSSWQHQFPSFPPSCPYPPIAHPPAAVGGLTWVPGSGWVPGVMCGCLAGSWGSLEGA